MQRPNVLYIIINAFLLILLLLLIYFFFLRGSNLSIKKIFNTFVNRYSKQTAITMSKDNLYFENETKIPIKFLIANFTGFKISERKSLLSGLKNQEKIIVKLVNSPTGLSIQLKNKDNQVYSAYGYKTENKTISILLYADPHESEKIVSRLNYGLLLATYMAQNQEKTFSLNESAARNIYLKQLQNIAFFSL